MSAPATASRWHSLLGRGLRGTGKTLRRGAHGAGDIFALTACVGGLRARAMIRMFESSLEEAMKEACGAIFDPIFRRVSEDDDDDDGGDDDFGRFITALLMIPILMPFALGLSVLLFCGKSAVGTTQVAGIPGLATYGVLRYIEKKDPELKHKAMFYARLGTLAALAGVIMKAQEAASDQGSKDDGDGDAPSNEKDGEGPVE